MNCKVCSIELNLTNARLRPSVPSGMRPLCKSCRNTKERPQSRLRPRLDKLMKVPDKLCENCENPCRTKGTRALCSDICRFIANISTDTKNGCWEWDINARDKDGYGKFRVNKKHIRPHRFSYELYNGSIPKDLYVCHECDNPPCVNPHHLWVGDNSDNQLDRYIKMALD
jgi:HNH endonuclease